VAHIPSLYGLDVRHLPDEAMLAAVEVADPDQGDVAAFDLDLYPRGSGV
jgi:hypothetical protein